MPSRKVLRIISLFYFFYFGSLGIYLPYLPLFLKSKGFSGIEIAFLISLLPIFKLISPPFWGYVSDVLFSPKKVLIGTTFLSGLAFVLFTIFQGRTAVIILLSLFALFRAPLIPLMNSLTFKFLGEKVENFTLVRVWGSVGFIVFATTIGKILSHYSIQLLFPIFMALILFANTFVSFLFPDLEPPARGKSKKDLIKLLTNRAFIFFIVVSMISRMADGPYYSFFSLHLKQLGFGETFIGIAWSVGVVAEIIVFLIAPRMLKTFSLKQILFVAYFAGVIRWALVALFKDPWILLFSQLFHGLTFGAFYAGSVSYVEKSNPPQFRATAQSIFASFAFNLGVLLGYLYSGPVEEKWGSSVLFLTASGISLIASILLIFLKEPGGKGETARENGVPG